MVRVYPDRDLNFISLLAQRITRLEANVIALLAATLGTPALVFAHLRTQSFDMGALMKESLATRRTQRRRQQRYGAGWLPRRNSGSAGAAAAEEVDLASDALKRGLQVSKLLLAVSRCCLRATVP